MNVYIFVYTDFTPTKSMATNKLNAKFCDAAQTGHHFDGDGLSLLVQKDGKKYWRSVTYVNGKRKHLGFGRYPKVSLKEAREKNQAAKKLAEQGIDPVQNKKELKQQQIKAAQQQAIDDGMTFEQVARRLHAAKEGRTTDEYRNKMLRQLEIHVFPHIGHKKMSDIKSKELLELFETVAKKTNHGRPMTYMAKKLCQWASEVYGLAHVEDIEFTANPCRNIIKHLPTHETKNMKRIDFKELQSFLNALEGYTDDTVTKAAIWMILYTGTRQISVRRAEWNDFDLEAETWQRKPEKGDKGSHLIPLSRQAIELLRNIRPEDANSTDFVFSDRPTYRMMSEATIGKAIKTMQFEMVGHGLRGVVSTGLNELGFGSPHLVKVQIGHKAVSTVEAAYNKAKYLEERKIMLQKWADYLDGLKQAAKNTAV